MNAVTQLQNDIADLLRTAPELADAGAVAVAENALDADAAVERALAETGLCLVVATPEVANGGEAADGRPALRIERLVVLCAESPPLNRERPGAITALDAALAAVRILHGGASRLSFKGLRQRVDGGLLLCECDFTILFTI